METNTICNYIYFDSDSMEYRVSEVGGGDIPLMSLLTTPLRQQIVILINYISGWDDVVLEPWYSYWEGAKTATLDPTLPPEQLFRQAVQFSGLSDEMVDTIIKAGNSLVNSGMLGASY